jgi:preprotein translocase subunit SecG
MINTLLFIHLIIAILLIIVILLQRTSSDGLSGIGGGGNNMGLVSGRSAANFLSRTTIILAIIFFCNALILANISSKPKNSVVNKIEKSLEDKSENEKTPETLPIAN